MRGKRGDNLLTVPVTVPIAKPLEDLLPVIEAGDLKLPRQDLFTAKFVHHSRLRKVPKRGNAPKKLLSVHFSSKKGNRMRDFTLYDTSELDVILLVQIKDKTNIVPELFQGEIGERVMRASLTVHLDRASELFPGFTYEIKRGRPREIIGATRHELVAFGKFANIWIYRTKTHPNASHPEDRMTNPLWDERQEIVSRRVGTWFPKESYRGCFETHKGEIDGLVTWDYVHESENHHGVIVCEAKSGANRNSPASTDNLEQLLYKLNVVQQCFPGRCVSYLLMASPEYLLHGGHAQQGKRYVTDTLRNVSQRLAKKDIPMMVLAYPFSSAEFAAKGESIYGAYRRLQKRSGGAQHWEQGEVKIERSKGILDLKFGLDRRIYLRNENGGWDPIESPERP